MDPPIEDIMAKWASLRIFHIIRRAEEKYQRLQIKHQLELLCRHSGVDFSSINFSSWSIGKDFLDSSSSDLLFRRYAAHLPIDSAVSEAGCFVHILLTICDLSAMMSGYQTADRLRRRKLVGLIASLANTPANSLLHTSSLRSLKKLLECGSFSPSDLLDPYRQISDLTDIIAVNTPHVRNNSPLRHTYEHLDDDVNIHPPLACLFLRTGNRLVRRWITIRIGMGQIFGSRGK